MSKISRSLYARSIRISVLSGISPLVESRIRHCRENYRKVDAAFGFAGATGRRLRRLVDVVGELAVLAVEDEPSSTPRPDATAHLDEEAGRSVRRDGDVSGTVDDEVAGLFDEREQVERLTADGEVPRQRPRLRPHTHRPHTR